MRTFAVMCVVASACAGGPGRDAAATRLADRHGFEYSAAVVLPNGEERHFGACDRRHSPASTFKVPHALIALDAGLLSGPGHSFAWDGEVRSFAAWNRDHTLATAIRDSVVWCFQRVARLVGRQRFEQDLPRLGYGNAQLGPELDRFWLDGSLQISAVEQARFWHRLHWRELPVSEESRLAVLGMTVLESDQERGLVLRGKTGWHEGDPVGGWFAGSLDCAEGTVCIAVRLAAEHGRYDVGSFLRARRLVAEDLLRGLGYSVPRPRRSVGSED